MNVLRRVSALICPFFAAAGLLFAPPAGAQEQKPGRAVILISIDGLRPDYVFDADRYALRIPNLRRFLKDGAYSSGVRGVVPTVTYPSHTTLLTGVAPSRHGISANTTFDPLRKNHGGWYWYAEDIKTPTLWDAAAAAGLVTLNVHWPVSVAARIRYNLPQYWRAGTADDRKLQRVLSTPGLVDELEKELGPYAEGIAEDVASDEVRAKFGARLIETKRPDFATIYLTALDHEQHASGPFSAESIATLERIDGALGRIFAAVENTYGGQALICVVSDHGFVRTEKAVHLSTALRREDLIQVDAKDQIQSWSASVWNAGGSAAIVLRDPKDTATQARVAALLGKLASDPANGIDRVISGDELHAHGGFPEASFLVALRPGYLAGDDLTGELIKPTATRGMHGYWPDVADMNSSFFAMGPGIPPAHALGPIDMRDIAPTLAKLLGVGLPSAEGKPLF